MKPVNFSITPIGYVRVKKGIYILEILPEYKKALNGLQDFSHINVLWWANLFDNENNRKIMEVKKPYKTAPPILGIFTTRSPIRPNPIALSVTPLIEINHKKGTIQVGYIDAEDGTPIIDLKPYHPSCDRVRDAFVPNWCSHWPKYYEDSANFDWSCELTRKNKSN